MKSNYNQLYAFSASIKTFHAVKNTIKCIAQNQVDYYEAAEREAAKKFFC